MCRVDQYASIGEAAAHRCKILARLSLRKQRRQGPDVASSLRGGQSPIPCSLAEDRADYDGSASDGITNSHSLPKGIDTPYAAGGDGSREGMTRRLVRPLRAL